MADKTKDELLAEARAAGVTIDNPESTTKAEIRAQLDGASASTPTGDQEGGASDPSNAPTPEVSDAAEPGVTNEGATADQALGPQHPASIVEEITDPDEKPGPASVMSREIRPDEQDLEPGTSALQAPPSRDINAE